MDRRVLAGAVGALLLVLVLLVVDATIASSASRQATERLEAALDAPVDVDVRGWPAGYRLLLGRPVDVRVVALDVPLPDRPVLLSRLELDLSDVTTVGGGFDDPDAIIVAERGTFTAVLDEDAVQGLLGIVGRIPLTDIELHRGVARLVFAGFPVVDATAEIVDGRVAFRPAAPIGSLLQVTLELDELPYGFRPTNVDIRRHELRLSGDATDLRFAPP